MTFFDV